MSQPTGSNNPADVSAGPPHLPVLLLASTRQLLQTLGLGLFYPLSNKISSLLVAVVVWSLEKKKLEISQFLWPRYAIPIPWAILLQGKHTLPRLILPYLRWLCMNYESGSIRSLGHLHKVFTLECTQGAGQMPADPMFIFSAGDWSSGPVIIDWNASVLSIFSYIANLDSIGVIFLLSACKIKVIFMFVFPKSISLFAPHLHPIELF